MNTPTIYIPIHSASDLITNSSSETFIRATDASVTQVKEIINSLLKLGDSNQSADDLFEFKLLYTLTSYLDDNMKHKARSVGIIVPEKSWEDTYATEDQIKAFIDSLTEAESEEFIPPWDDCDEYNVSLQVIPKNPENEETNKIANLLNGFIDSFDRSSRYNG